MKQNKYIAVSACLVGCNCKYNGKNNYNERVMRFLEGKNVIEVCPEVMGGLSTPRVPCELVDGVAFNKNGENVNDAFEKGTEAALEKLSRYEIECVILQSRSPSCGVNSIYDGTFTGKIIKGSGKFAAALKKRGYKVIDAEDI